jgi:phage gp29-like protein
VSLAQVREKLALDEPQSDEDILEGRKTAAPADPTAGDVKPPTSKAKTSHLPNCPCCGGSARASQGEQDSIDQLLADAFAEGAGDLDGVIEPVLALASQSADFDDFMARLSAVAGEQDTGAIMTRLGPLMFMARGLGDATDNPDA